MRPARRSATPTRAQPHRFVREAPSLVPGPALVHAGETILPAHGGGSVGAGAGTNVYLGPVMVTGTDQRTAEEFARKISEILRSNIYGNVNTLR